MVRWSGWSSLTLTTILVWIAVLSLLATLGAGIVGAVFSWLIWKIYRDDRVPAVKFRGEASTALGIQEDGNGIPRFEQLIQDATREILDSHAASIDATSGNIENMRMRVDEALGIAAEAVAGLPDPIVIDQLQTDLTAIGEGMVTMSENLPSRVRASLDGALGRAQDIDNTNKEEFFALLQEAESQEIMKQLHPGQRIVLEGLIQGNPRLAPWVLEYAAGKVARAQAQGGTPNGGDQPQIPTQSSSPASSDRFIATRA